MAGLDCSGHEKLFGNIRHPSPQPPTIHSARFIWTYQIWEAGDLQSEIELELRDTFCGTQANTSSAKKYAPH